MQQDKIYQQILSEIKDLDRRIQCLNACFSVVSNGEMLDSVNYQLLSLNKRRWALFKHLRTLKKQSLVSGK